jgi:hypothetical protein
MPVPRIFEAQFDPREHWTHVVATLLGLAGPQTRGALVEEITGEELPEADAILVREQRPLGSADAPLVADIVARGAGWTVAVQSSLAFDVNEAELLAATWDALSEVADKSILVALTPDRREPAALGEAREGGRDIRHLSWLRTRDWVQERPERGKAEGVDLMLLREAEYFLTPRVAELYRLESVMPLMSEALRPALASIFFTLNDLSPAPLILTGGDEAATATFPRTGDAGCVVAVNGDVIELRVRTDDTGAGSVEGPDAGWRTVQIRTDEDWLAARSWTRGVARDALPVRR